MEAKHNWLKQTIEMNYCLQLDVPSSLRRSPERSKAPWLVLEGLY